MPAAELILASASPRRAELLRTMGVNFRVARPGLREPAARPEHLSPATWAEALAYWKARSVAELQPDAWVLAADTLVVCGGRMLGKPRGLADARRMLELQARAPGDVLTGVCLLWSPARPGVSSQPPVADRPGRLAAARGRGPLQRNANRAPVQRHFLQAATRVWMRDDPDEREAYLRSGDWRGKAGAYGIQDVGDRLVLRWRGSFSNVVGLPLECVAQLLRCVGVLPPG